MALFYLVRHGQADYTPCEERGYIGHGKDLAPLSEQGVREAEETAKDIRLMGADIIVASPYTRALQTAAIISRQTGIKLTVEMDFHEWMPDITFQFKTFDEVVKLNEDFNKFKGIYPVGIPGEEEQKRWESLTALRQRVKKAADKYAHYDRVIVVCHGMAIRTLVYAGPIKNGEIIECKYEAGQPDCEFSFA